MFIKKMYEVMASQPPLSEVASLLHVSPVVNLDVTLAADDISQSAELRINVLSEVPEKLGLFAICGTFHTEDTDIDSKFYGLMEIADGSESAVVFAV